jgi:twitching motility two-component system response regulator PilH
MKKGKVLLVDDNTDMELIGERIFARAGFEYLSARSGQEGLEQAKAAQPDIIVLDYMLPDINGTQFLRHMTADPEYANLQGIPVVVLTARTDYIEDLDECFRMGMRAFLNKPFGHRELVNIIDSILRFNEVQPATPLSRSRPASPPAEMDERRRDELSMICHTIARLSKELRDDTLQLDDQQRMNVNAIYTSSKRLIALLEKPQ